MIKRTSRQILSALFLVSSTLAHANPHIGHEPIFEEAGCGATGGVLATTPGAFILPNENRNCVHAKLLHEKRGTLISVGTLRTLFNATLGNFSRVILLDCDPTTTAFNRRNIEFISRLSKSGWSPYKQRLFYMATLSGVQFSEDDVDLFIITHEDSPAAITKWSTEMTKRPLFSASKLKSDPVGPLEPLLSEFRTSYSPRKWKYKISSLTERSHQMVYWADNARWEKIQRLIESGHLIAVNGSITGNTTLKSIGNALKRQDPPESVSVMDISNSGNYFRPTPSHKTGMPENAFLKNMAVLPLDENAHVLYTHMFGDPQQRLNSSPGCEAPDYWNYEAVAIGSENRASKRWYEVDRIAFQPAQLRRRASCVSFNGLDDAPISTLFDDVNDIFKK